MLRITLWLLALGALLLAVRALRLRAAPSPSLRTGRTGGDRQKRGGSGQRGRWHSVSIECDYGCEAAMALSGQRFLPAEAPPIPVPGCDSPSCGCRYARHDERRSEDDRRFGFGTFNGFNNRAGLVERREKTERRSAEPQSD